MKYPSAGQEQKNYEQTVTRVTWNPGQDLAVLGVDEVVVAPADHVCRGEARDGVIDVQNRPLPILDHDEFIRPGKWGPEYEAERYKSI